MADHLLKQLKCTSEGLSCVYNLHVRVWVAVFRLLMNNRVFPLDLALQLNSVTPSLPPVSPLLSSCIKHPLWLLPGYLKKFAFVLTNIRTQTHVTRLQDELHELPSVSMNLKYKRHDNVCFHNLKGKKRPSKLDCISTQALS